MRIQLTNGRITGVRFYQPQPELSFRRAWRRLFDPDIPDDEPDGLPMLTELARTGRLSGPQRGRLKQQLQEHGSSPFLRQHRETCWGRHRPPPEQFW